MDRVLVPLDVLRRAAFLRARRLPGVGTALRRAETRIPIFASAGVVIAFALTAFAPGALFVLGPALLGVVHVASDVRYLALRARLPTRWVVAVGAGCALLIGSRVAELAEPGALPFARIEVGIGWTWGLVGAWLGASTALHAGRWRRALFLSPALGAATVLAVSHPAQARALFAYGHNLATLAVWFVLFRRVKSRAAAPVALVAAGVIALLIGTTLPWIRADGPWVGRLLEEARGAVPGVAGRTAVVIALTYVFLQAVHYSVWLAWIPQEQARGDATLTFRMSAQAARRDFGPWGLALVLALAVAVGALSLASVHRTRALYLSVATFHGYLELACLAFLWARAGQGSGPPMPSAGPSR